jgi:excisionase family DNA binding protein
MLSLSEAARVSGQSKSTIRRAINSGRLSATRTYTGDYLIDPAGLHRVSLGTEGRATTVSVKRDSTDLERAETAQIDRLFQVGELIRNELDNDRDAWRSQADGLRQLVG